MSKSCGPSMTHRKVLRFFNLLILSPKAFSSFVALQLQYMKPMNRQYHIIILMVVDGRDKMIRVI